MDFGKSFTFMFDDKDWVGKILIGALFALLSIALVGIPFLVGYTLEVVRRAAAGREDALPAWDDLGDKFVQGLVLLVIFFVFMLPATLLSGCLGASLSTISENIRSDAGATIFGLGAALVGLLASAYAFVVGLFYPAITMRYAMTRDFGATFNLAELWRVATANLGSYIIVLLVTWVAGLIAGFGVIACVIGVFVTYFWGMLVSAHITGQYWHENLTSEVVAPSEPDLPSETTTF